ncbi:MAG: hypothetical protein JST12_18115 [Armatimonadetes bacterium]|nr:hypothetical protein [Armatimonadota bacterium]
MNMTRSVVTSKRRLHAIFDKPDMVLLQPGFWRYKAAKDIARTAGQTKTVAEVIDCQLMGDYCWQLKPKQVEDENVSSRTTAQDAILHPNTDYKAPEGFVEQAGSHDTSDLTDSTDEGDSILGIGDWRLQKNVMAGDSWRDSKYRLVTEQYAFAGDTSDHTYAMDRIISFKDTDEPNGARTIRFQVAGGQMESPGLLLTHYFAGPQSATGNLAGMGFYCVKLFGSGRAELRQFSYIIDTSGHKTGEKWHTEATFTWAPNGQVSGRNHVLTIIRHKLDPPHGALFGVIDVQTSHSTEKGVSAPGRGNSFLAYTKEVPKDILHHRCVWNLKFAPFIPVSQKESMDCATNVRPKIQVLKSIHPPTGTILDDPIGLETMLGLEGGELSDDHWYVTWFGDTPDGTSIDIDLCPYSSDSGTGVPYTSNGSGTIGRVGAWKSYTLDPTEQMPTVQVKLTLSTTNVDVTPSVYGVRITRKSIIDLTETTPFEIKSSDGIMSLDIKGPDRDPAAETASFTVNDFQGSYDRLNRRGFLPVEISTEYDAGDDVDWTNPANDYLRPVLFQGYIEAVHHVHPGVKDPLDRKRAVSEDFRQYQVTAYGNALRGSMYFANQQVDFNLARDDDAVAGNPKLPWKATDAIRYALRSMGYPDSMIDLPDIEIRLFPNDEEGIRVQPGTVWMDFAVSIAKDYLASILVFDPNASRDNDSSAWRGMWRLIIPPTQTYTHPLAYFALKRPASGGTAQWVPAEDEKAWPTVTYLGRDVPGTFILRDSMKPIVEAPAANFIVVMGASGDKGDSRVMQISPNPKSYKSVYAQSAPDPDHEDYIGMVKPLYYVDSQIGGSDGRFNENIVNFVSARLYQNLAHAKKTLTFTAPLLLVEDDNDDLQVRPRPLRIADEIVIFDKNANPYAAVVLSCNPTVVKDCVQMATYEVIFPPETATDIQL